MYISLSLKREHLFSMRVCVFWFSVADPFYPKGLTGTAHLELSSLKWQWRQNRSPLIQTLNLGFIRPDLQFNPNATHAGNKQTQMRLYALLYSTSLFFALLRAGNSANAFLSEPWWKSTSPGTVLTLLAWLPWRLSLNANRYTLHRHKR